MKKTRWLPQYFFDSHCHGRDMRQAHKTTIYQVLLEAWTAGIGISVFMPNTNPAIVTIFTLLFYMYIMIKAEKRLKLGRQYLYFGATDHNYLSVWMALKFRRVLGIKIYPKAENGRIVTTGDCGIAKNSSLKKHMELAWKAKKVLAVHCDHPKVIQQEGHSINAEVGYVKKILRMAPQFPGIKILICHASCRETIEEVLIARRAGINVAVELMPHYLWLDSNGTNWNTFDSKFYDCFNRLRNRYHREFLVGLLSLNLSWIWVASDSACHTRKEKLAGAAGIPSNQEMVAVVLTLAEELNLSSIQVANLLIYNAANFLGIEVSKKLVEYKLEWKIDNLRYNNGNVVNPWNGSRLFFPSKL